jgi:outer membrane protein OmpA-like peptidoglycan-associated protein
MKRYITLLFTLLLVITNLKAEDTWRVYVTTFQAKDTNFEADAISISNDFQYVFQGCNQRFEVLDRRYYSSWVEDAKTKTVDESKTLLNFQDVDYIVFGEVVYNGILNIYSIEYGFEEVKTGQILFLDKLAFNSLNELKDKDFRYKKISNRITKEFELCQNDSKKAKQKMVQIKSSVQHKLRDTDKDGVPDIIDEEPETPANALVNSKGVAYTEVELETAKKNSERTESVVDSAKVKEDEMTALLKQMMPTLPTISFLTNVNRVEEETYTQLHQIAKIMEMYPAMRIIVTGNTKGISTTLAYQRTYNTITYLMDNYNLPQKRLILEYKLVESENKNTVFFDVTMNEERGDMSEPKH